MKILISTVHRDPSGFSERLRVACGNKQLDAANIAQAMDLSYEAVRKWFSGKAKPSEKSLVDLANLLDVSASWLRFGETGAELSNDKLRIRHIPLVSLTGMTDMGVRVLSAVPVSEDSIGFDMKGDSMEPVIHEGWRCVVDRAEPAKPGDVVLYNYGNGFGVCRTLIQEGGQFMLKPENRQYAIEPAILANIEGPVVFTGYRPHKYPN